VVQVRADLAGIDLVTGGKEAFDMIAEIGLILSGEGDFDTVAGGQDEGFLDAGLGAQSLERFRELGVRKGDSFADGDGRRLVVQAGNGKPHGANLRPM
jgi:hypothetical protein